VTFSAFDLFKIGIGPSSSHTVGPMRAAGMFVGSLAEDGVVDRVAGIRAELFGSLGATGHGHGSVKAIVLGLSGERPETVDPAAAAALVASVSETGVLRLPRGREIEFDPDEDIVLHRRKRLPFHSNAMRFAAAAVGTLFKENASISGAEVGCQGEVGSACSMAAAGLAEVIGGSPEQVENAAEIAVEHNLGLTCDPVGGLVQIPCIERNAIASVKAITAARMAVRGDGTHYVSLDKAIKTMRETGADMKDKYKETARGGLAVNVIEC
jgi:L-serine deaminase